MPNKYVQLDYSDDIDEGIFDYAVYSNAVFRPSISWSSRDCNDIMTYDHSKYNKELSKCLKIGKRVNLNNTRAIKSLVSNTSIASVMPAQKKQYRIMNL